MTSAHAEKLICGVPHILVTCRLCQGKVWTQRGDGGQRAFGAWSCYVCDTCLPWRTHHERERCTAF